MEDLWPIITVVGPILLAVVILYALFRNRQMSRREMERGERATHENYREDDRNAHG